MVKGCFKSCGDEAKVKATFCGSIQISLNVKLAPISNDAANNKINMHNGVRQIKVKRNMYLLRIQLVAIYVMAPITKMNANGKPKTIRRSSAYLFKKLFMSKFNINDIVFFVDIAISSNEWPK